MGAILKLNLSRNTNTKTLALNSTCKDTIYLTLLKTESISDISSSNVRTINTL